MTDPQKLVDQVKEAIKYYLENFYHSMGSGRIGHDAYAALDQLSAYLAEREKTVRELESKIGGLMAVAGRVLNIWNLYCDTPSSECDLPTLEESFAELKALLPQTRKTETPNG